VTMTPTIRAVRWTARSP